jgi:hypothetical protein
LKLGHDATNDGVIALLRKCVILLLSCNSLSEGRAAVLKRAEPTIGGEQLLDRNAILPADAREDRRKGFLGYPIQIHTRFLND